MRLSPSLTVVALRSVCVLARLGCLLVAARAMEPTAFAAVALAIAASEIAKVFADAGVDVYSLREYGRHRSEAIPEIARTTAAAKAAGCTLAAVGLLLALWIAGIDVPFPIRVCVVLLPTNQLTFNYFLNLGLVRNTAQTLIAPAIAAYGPFCCLLVAVFVLQKYPALPFVGLVVCEVAMLLVMALRRTPQAESGRAAQPSAGALMRMFRGAWPVGAAAAIAIVYGRLDLFAIKKLCSEADVGLYAFASRVLDPAWQLVAGWIATHGGTFAALWTRQREQFVQRGKRLLVLGVLCSVAAFAIIALSARPVLTWLFPAFSGSATAMGLLGLALLPRILNNTFTMLLISCHRERAIPVISAINLCTLSAGLALLVPVWGIVGAASAVLLAESCNTLMQGWLFQRALGEANA